MQGTRLFHIVEKYLLSVQGYADYTSFLGSRQKLSNMNNDCIHVGASEIKLVSSVRNLGPWFDSSLSVNEQVAKAKRSAACTTYRKSGSCRIRRINQDSDLRIRHVSCGLLQLVAVWHFNMSDGSTIAIAECCCGYLVSRFADLMPTLMYRN